jgi:hypothetical protein
MASETPIASPRRRIRSGVAAFVCSIVLIAWVIALIYLAIGASGSEVVGVIAYVMFFASWVVVPVLLIGMLVLAIIALLLNPVPGKILGALAIVAPVVAAVLFWNALGAVDLGTAFS